MADSVSSASSASYLLPGSTNRMFGLASGLDIDSMVSKLMQAEEVPLDQMKQQQQLLQWKQDDYRSMNSLLLDLYNSTFDMTLQSNYLLKTAVSTDDTLVTATAGANSPTASYSLQDVTLATAATNYSAGAITTASDFDPSQSLWVMRNKINNFSVQDGTPVSGESITVDADGKSTFYLKNALIDSSATTTINVNSNPYTVYFTQDSYNGDTTSANKVLVDPSTGKLTFNHTLSKNDTITSSYTPGIGSTDTVVSPPETIDVSSDGTTFNLQHKNISTSTLPTISVDNNAYTVYFDKSQYDADTSKTKVLVNSSTGQLTFGQTIKAGSSISAGYTYKKGVVNFTITTPDENGNMKAHDFDFTPSSSLNDIMNSVNNSDAGVTMFYDTSTNKVSIVRNVTGDNNPDDNTTSPPTKNYEMEFTGSFLTSTLQLNQLNEQGGTDAKVTINGLVTTRHENTFTINGTTFTLKSNFTNKVTVNINNDADGMFDKIKSWVDKYNDTIKKINDKISEKKNRDYPPLTDAKKQSMKDSDITLWNDKAMSGMLSDDQLLPSGLDQMRMDIYTSVGGLSDTNYDQLSKIGITTSSDYTDNGKLEIDESKLKAAIAADPTAVMNLFTNNGVPSGGTDPVYANEGIMQRLQTTIQNTMNSIYQQAGKDTYTYDQFSLGKEIHDYDNQISDMMTHLQDVQNRYYTQFTAMEQSIQQANQQGAFISQNFGG